MNKHRVQASTYHGGFCIVNEEGLAVSQLYATEQEAYDELAIWIVDEAASTARQLIGERE